MKYGYIGLVLLGLLAASCKVTEQYRRPAGSSVVYREQAADDTSTIASVNWRDFFKDPALQKLIEKGLQENLDLKMAVQRIIAAQANYKQSRQAFLPDVNGSVSVKESRLSYPQGYGIINSATQYDIGITANWEADIWGKLRSSKRAAFANLLGTEAAKRAIQSKLVSDVAAAYYSLLALDAQLKVLELTLANRKEDVAAMYDLKASAIVNGAAIVQSEANQYTVEVAIPDTKRQIRETENFLCMLLGQPSGTIERSRLSTQQLPGSLAVGVPAQLLMFRPDVQEAELNFRSAFELNNVARTAFYPSLNIGAAGGFSSFDFSQWFSSTGLFANVVGGLTQPIFNRGLNKARLKTAQAKQQEAFYNFSKVLLMAGREVSDALYALQSASEKESSRSRQLQALEKAVDFTKDLLRYSETTNYTDVLTSEQHLLNAQVGQIGDQLQQWQAVIALYKAVGGGAM
ncbi:NodT family efflux transporter outer membrane factor (OMF) lipoprotein [Chitinophaga terrae (ex Kim and Jung 2007)]|uniref:efflux transporter outer membrane subunit n=1 Tax=Chitinophaga terrae (ex Kim and Jung 2007) TaxID=408074 RepID=UPI0027811F23|nr:efflux transporter outer membrane subunit [Chitinophaga terrae (ex Kim and Jung 2007)]MDQ0109953.1 NodT family efflux transporter outer membrane factor (OMF) lipoprotein [Chitinophaga terrae (ex Kim and Jung 2007)]